MDNPSSSLQRATGRLRALGHAHVGASTGDRAITRRPRRPKPVPTLKGEQDRSRAVARRRPQAANVSQTAAASAGASRLTAIPAVLHVRSYIGQSLFYSAAFCGSTAAVPHRRF